MSPNPPRVARTAPPPAAVRPPRPKVVEYAVYVLIARCIIAVLSGLAAYGDRPEITRQFADAYKKDNWDAATLHSKVDAALKNGLISALVLSVLVILLAFMIWQGKNYARYLYLVLAVIIAKDLPQLRGFFITHDSFVYAALTTMIGVCSVATLILLFLPASNAYFRRPGGAAPDGILGALMGARTTAGGPAAAGRTATRGRPATRGEARVSLAKSSRPAAAKASAQPSVQPAARSGLPPATRPVTQPVTRSGAPRGKSRQAPPKQPGAR